MDEQTREHDAGEPLPDWLWDELSGLAADFAHLPQPARYDAMRRNMSQRAWAYFTERAERHVRETSGDARGG